MDVKEEVNVASGSHVVQIPIELTSPVHRRLAQWCRETACILDVPGLARGDVIEALIDQLVDDSHTSDAVRHRLAELAGYRSPATPATCLPTRALGGVRTGQALTHRRQLVTGPLAVPVTQIDHRRSSAGHPARLGAARERGESVLTGEPMPIETLGA